MGEQMGEIFPEEREYMTEWQKFAHARNAVRLFDFTVGVFEDNTDEKAAQVIEIVGAYKDQALKGFEEDQLAEIYTGSKASSELEETEQEG